MNSKQAHLLLFCLLPLELPLLAFAEAEERIRHEEFPASGEVLGSEERGGQALWLQQALLQSAIRAGKGFLH